MFLHRVANPRPKRPREEVALVSALKKLRLAHSPGELRMGRDIAFLDALAWAVAHCRLDSSSPRTLTIEFDLAKVLTASRTLPRPWLGHAATAAPRAPLSLPPSLCSQILARNLLILCPRHYPHDRPTALLASAESPSSASAADRHARIRWHFPLRAPPVHRGAQLSQSPEPEDDDDDDDDDVHIDTKRPGDSDAGGARHVAGEVAAGAGAERVPTHTSMHLLRAGPATWAMGRPLPPRTDEPPLHADTVDLALWLPPLRLWTAARALDELMLAFVALRLAAAARAAGDSDADVEAWLADDDAHGFAASV
jgi:hypothetical protein